ncbi:MAG: hypothetical protein HXS46_17325 [Theionarchaea archaeon]|nr:hypothetical protein [Theionarchaea archaeon]
MKNSSLGIGSRSSNHQTTHPTELEPTTSAAEEPETFLNPTVYSTWEST